MDTQSQQITEAALTASFLGRAGTWTKPWPAMSAAEQTTESRALIDGCRAILTGTALLAAASIPGREPSPASRPPPQQRRAPRAAASPQPPASEKIVAGTGATAAAQKRTAGARGGRRPAAPAGTETRMAEQATA